MKKNADTERERQERELTALKEQMDKLSIEIKAAETKHHRAETRVGGTCGDLCQADEIYQRFRDTHVSPDVFHGYAGITQK